jgi:cell division protein ZapE
MFHTVCISNIPIMSDAEDSEAKRFMHLIDALYDHRVKLIVTAQAEANNLYHGSRMQNDFKRTISRLIEMGSHDYLALAHRV